MNITFIRWRQKLLFFSAILLCTLAFAVDYYGAVAMTGGILYTPVILYVSFSRSKRIVIGISSLATLFTLLADIMPLHATETFSPLDTGIALTVIWIITAMCFFLIDKDEKVRLFARIVRNCPDQITTNDLDGVVTSWNEGATAMYGYSAFDMIGKNVSILIPEYKKAEQQEYYRKIISGLSVQNLETERIRKDGSIIQVSLTITPVFAPDATVIGMALMGRDISALKEAEEKSKELSMQLKKHAVRKTVELEEVKINLRKNAEYFKSLIENSLDIITVIDSEGLITFQNDSCLRYLGYEPSEMAGKVFLDYVHPQHISAFLHGISRASMEWEEDSVLEILVRHKDGSWHTLEAVMLNLHANNEIAGIVINARDVTERKRLTQEVLRISEREQARMAQELHDGITQQLAGIAFMAKGLRDTLVKYFPDDDMGSSPPAKEAENLYTHLQEAVRNTRQLARGMYPVGLEAENFIGVLKAMIEDLKKQHGTNIRFSTHDGFTVDDDITAGHLYHIILESLRNGLTHGKAKNIEISFSGNDKENTIAIRDDGRGMSEPKNSSRGIGLKIMNHRVRMMKGFFDLQQNSSGGTTVVCTIPKIQPNHPVLLPAAEPAGDTHA